MGNIHSIVKALRLFHDEVVFTADPSVLGRAVAIVLPGDGAFAAAMQHLHGRFRDLIGEHVHNQKPLLGVCIGFQVLFEDSDEFAPDSPGVPVKGLGLVPGRVRRFPVRTGERVPHMGWNELVDARGELQPWQGEYMYFIHSYRPVDVPDQYVSARCEYAGDRFPAAIHHGSIAGVQFHPEKSWRAGLSLLESWTRSVLV